MAASRDIHVKITADASQFKREMKRVQRVLHPQRAVELARLAGSLRTLLAVALVWLGLAVSDVAFNPGALVGVAAGSVLVYAINTRWRR